VCCDGDIMWDSIDEDRDVEIWGRKNIYNPMWDEYTHMLYRSTNFNRENPRFTDYLPAGMIYDTCQEQLTIQQGNYSRCGAYLGCTGCGPYLNTSKPETPRGSDTVPWTNNPTALDIFARDTLILKHFRFKSFTIFICADIIELSNGREWGFFKQYGIDALDRLMTLVNGPNSTTPFVIYQWGNLGDFRSIWEDAALSFDHLDHLPLMIVYLCGAVAIMFWDKWTKIPQFLKKIQNKILTLSGNYS
jgi:hypothetical protein